MEKMQFDMKRFEAKAAAPAVGPKGRPIAEKYFKDELPKILLEFEIKHPADKRFWKLAKTDFSLIQQKVAYIKETREADQKKGVFKKLPEYSGLLIWLLFPKKKVIKGVDGKAPKA